MHRPVFVFIALLGLVFNSRGFAQDSIAEDQSVRAPYVELGDCWTYRVESYKSSSSEIFALRPRTNYRGRTDSYEICVTFVDKKRNVILTVATNKEDGREIEESYTAEWGPSTTIRGVIFTPPARFVRFPLRVGDTYSSNYEYRAASRGPNAGKATWKTTVVGWENITVPAGTFRALKIVGRGFFERYDRDLTFYGDLIAWYVPEVGRHVKYQYKDFGVAHGEELVGFRLNK